MKLLSSLCVQTIIYKLNVIDPSSVIFCFLSLIFQLSNVICLNFYYVQEVFKITFYTKFILTNFLN